MANYTEDSLDKPLTKGLISIVLSQLRIIDQDNVGWLDEIRKLNYKFSKLEADVKIAKSINNLLSRGVVDLERQYWANAQCSRRECLEVAGILHSVDDNSLEEKVIQVFEEKLVVTLKRVIIVKKNDRIIVKFSWRKDCQRVLSVKKNLEKLKAEDIGLTGANKISVNYSLCPYYRVLNTGKSII